MAEISLLHVHGEAIGYGRLGVQLSKSLTDAGVDVYDHQGTPEELLLSNADEKVAKKGSRSSLTNVVCWVSVPTHARGWWAGQHPAIFSMWEATRLPESFRETLHNFETVVVPSDHNVELFGEYHDNVRRCFLGVDPTQWHYMPRQPPAQYFNFLIGGSGPRKGTDLTYRAFKTLWGREGSWPSDGPIPRLIMKNPRREGFAGSRIDVIGGRMSNEDEIALYASAHCYVQPSRGEGFGLQPLQAMAQGTPTILTDAHGHRAFSHLGLGLPTTMAKAAQFVYGDAGEWWEPDFDTLCDQMRWVYDNYDAAVDKAFDGARWIAENMTWAHTAAQFIDAFDGALERPFAGDTSNWVEPDQLRFRVIPNADFTINVAGSTHEFRRGVETWEMADVKRILFEADRLDPACLTEDNHGLTAFQVERMGAYSARHGYCTACGQRLNSGPTRSDDIYEELNRGVDHR